MSTENADAGATATEAQQPMETDAEAQQAATSEAVDAGAQSNANDASALPSEASADVNPATKQEPAASSGAEASAPPAEKTNKKAAMEQLSIRQYLDSTVVPVLLAGMSQLTKERPDCDEVEWLANWMLENNPNKKKDPMN